MVSKSRWYEIDYLRVYLIFALIACHAFAPFNTWPAVCNTEIGLYRYIAKFAYSSMLETFVFISGFLFYGKLMDGVRFRQLVVDKFTRLLQPCYVFGLLYVVLCDEIAVGKIYEIFNGYGHLWFLPMLFWVFVIYYYMFPIVNKHVIFSSIVIFALAILPYPSMPMHLNNAMYYLLFFHFGVIVRSIERVKLRITSFRKLPFIAILYVVLFVVGTLITEKYLLIYPDIPMVKKAAIVLLYNVCRFTYSIIGVMLFYGLAYNVAKAQKVNMTAFAGLCFGIYLFQEIILRLLYYKLHITSYVGPYLSPWIASVVTLIVSIVLVKFIRQSRIVKTVI